MEVLNALFTVLMVFFVIGEAVAYGVENGIKRALRSVHFEVHHD